MNNNNTNLSNNDMRLLKIYYAFDYNTSLHKDIIRGYKKDKSQFTTMRAFEMYLSGKKYTKMNLTIPVNHRGQKRNRHHNLYKTRNGSVLYFTRNKVTNKQQKNYVNPEQLKTVRSTFKRSRPAWMRPAAVTTEKRNKNRANVKARNNNNLPLVYVPNSNRWMWTNVNGQRINPNDHESQLF